ncbi:unnamed protein product [Sphagnum balticum]
MNEGERGRQKGKENTELRILDYRNGKYQGTTAGINMMRSGVGMVLDHNYLLGVGQWRNGQLEGAGFIIFPDGSLFCGFLRQTIPWRICSYQVARKYSILGNMNETS